MGEDNPIYKLDNEYLIDLIPCALYAIKDSVIIDCSNAAIEYSDTMKKRDFKVKSFSVVT